MNNKLSLGLDIGTNSVGWALVDENNDIVKKGKFSMWGVRMFDEASDASERRAFRTARRRTARRKERIRLLRMLLNDEIVKVDPYFFQRLDESFFERSDKRLGNHYNLFEGEFNDSTFDREYGYHTIYHLRKDMLINDKKFDIRMLYLALHHMIKYRGHFLYSGDNVDKKDNSQILEYLEKFNEKVIETSENFEDDGYFTTIELSEELVDKLVNILKTNSKVREKEALLIELLNPSKKKNIIKEVAIPLLLMRKINISNLEIVKERKVEKTEIIIASENFEQDLQEAASKFKDLEWLIEELVVFKSINDHCYLLRLLGDSTSISDAMVKQYNKHAEQLKELRKLIKDYLPEKYNFVFRKANKGINNYAHYIGYNRSYNKIKRFSHCTRDEFYDFLKKILAQITDERAAEKVARIRESIESQEYLLRQNSDKNSSLPMQLNLEEMKVILANQAKYYPFLNEVSDGYSVTDKIISIFKFKIPYYVGPLSTKSSYSWVERTNEKILPWNFEKVVNEEESSKKFIQRMQNKCTYLMGDDDYCLPKKSILYSEYMCLSYLNKIRINGKLIDVDLKNEIFENVFLNKYNAYKDIKKPTRKDIKNYLESKFGKQALEATEELNDFACDMSSYIVFKKVFNNVDENIDLIENIIKDITIFEDKKLLKRRLRSLYKLSDDQINIVSGFSFKDYGRLSKRLLTEINDGTHGSIIQIMRETNCNLVEIIEGSTYHYRDQIDEYNKDTLGEVTESFEEFIEEHVYTSPVMKRPLIQAYKIVEEVERIMGKPIDSYYVECTRGEDYSNESKSRYNKIKEILDSCDGLFYDINVNRLKDQLEKCNNEGWIKRDKIYLYFTQLGRSLYSFKPIDFDKLINDNGYYDIDHIYPQAFIQDDSLNNKVLVEKQLNNQKKDTFLFEMSSDFRPMNLLKPFYKLLLDKELITKKKYERLIQSEISQEEVDGFVNRQLVVTNQAVKGLIEVLKLFKKVNPSNIVYSRASNVSHFRQEYDIPKSRLANNYHHAHDAYLNVVVGRAINDYYTKHRFVSGIDYRILKNENVTINPMNILKYDRTFNGTVIWKKDETIAKIKKYIFTRFDISETVLTTTSNSLYSKVTIKPAEESSNSVPVKTNDSRRLNTEKYGGITSYAYAKYALISTMNKGKREYILIGIPTAFRNNPNGWISKEFPNFELIHDDIRTNVVVEDGKKKFYIRGVMSNNFTISTYCDRHFSIHSIRIIKKIEKCLKDVNMSDLNVDDDIVYLKANIRTGEVATISRLELDQLLLTIKETFLRDCYCFSIIKKIVSHIEIKNYKMIDYIKLCNQLLGLIQTNTSQTADLTLIDMGKTAGLLNISRKLQPGMKLYSYSITGYYKKLLFEVPSGI